MIHEEASKTNRQRMFDFALKLSDKKKEVSPLNGLIHHLGDEVRQCFVTSDLCHHQPHSQPTSLKHKVVSDGDSQPVNDRPNAGDVKVYIGSSDGNPIPSLRVSSANVIATSSSR